MLLLLECRPFGPANRAGWLDLMTQHATTLQTIRIEVYPVCPDVAARLSACQVLTELYLRCVC